MSKNCPVAQSPKGGDHALLQYVTVHVGIHGSLNELWLPSAGSTHAAPDHDTPTTMLDWRQNTLVFCTPHLVAATHAWHHLNKTSLCWSHQTTGHGSSNPNCLRAFLCIIFRRGFLLGQQPCRPIWCSVGHMVWELRKCVLVLEQIRYNVFDPLQMLTIYTNALCLLLFL